MASSEKFIPGSDVDAEDIFDYPYFNDDETKKFINGHRKIIFIVRGPPGTGKKTLADMIVRHYPDGIKCSADDYFSKTFNSAVRNRESLKKSHDYCHMKVKQECVKGTHPIIVSNTHMKKIEMQKYLDYAAEYGYTVIMSITMDKFKVTPEILEKSNTKGLTKEYFTSRLKQWQDVFPILTGWFLGIDDTYFVLDQLQLALDALLGDGKFCRVFNTYDKDQLFNCYQANDVLFCVAGYSKNSSYEIKNYYQSAEIKDSYGKCFEIMIQAFIITHSYIFAVVHVDDSLAHLKFKPVSERTKDYSTKLEDSTDNISASFMSLSVQNCYKFKTIPLNNTFPKKHETAKLVEEESDALNISENTSFICIAQREEKPFCAWKMSHLFKNCLLSSTEAFEFYSSGGLSLNQFSDLEGGYRMLRLPNEAWLIKPPKNILVKTVFTGLYI